ncbi:MAG: hypothetical protein SFY66_18650 [Oculatellaceae cyanobacterium bins.114]|nr:hypothetical protein [Oculatellaceae cyanobacterium bins.114]
MRRLLFVIIGLIFIPTLAIQIFTNEEKGVFYGWGFSFLTDYSFEENCIKTTVWGDWINPNHSISEEAVEDRFCSGQKVSERSPKLFQDLGCTKQGTVWTCLKPMRPQK